MSDMGSCGTDRSTNAQRKSKNKMGTKWMSHLRMTFFSSTWSMDSRDFAESLSGLSEGSPACLDMVLGMMLLVLESETVTKNSSHYK